MILAYETDQPQSDVTHVVGHEKIENPYTGTIFWIQSS